jgi:hypothetical protein
MDGTWEAATYGTCVRYADGSIMRRPSKRRQRITESIEDLAAFLQPDGIDEYEREDLERVVEGLMTEIQRRLYAFAEGHHERWEAHREGKGHPKAVASA